jgi:hypothetical protein
LYYCVQSYDTKVVNGTLFENHVTADDSARGQHSWQIRNEGYDGTANASTITNLAFDGFYSSLLRTDLQLGSAYNISQTAVDWISSYFQRTFANDTGNLSFDPSGVNGKVNGWYITTGKIQYKPSIASVLYESENMTDRFNTLAVSMSNAMRMGSDGAANQDGCLQVLYVKVRVEWEWISLHVLAIGIGTLFWLHTVWETKVANSPVWTSSSLAILWAGEHAADILPDSVVSKKSLEKAAKGASMQLLGSAKAPASSAMPSAPPPLPNAHSSPLSSRSVSSAAGATMQGAIPPQTLAGANSSTAPSPTTSRRSSVSSLSSVGGPNVGLGQHSASSSGQPVLQSVGYVASTGNGRASITDQTFP